MSTHQPLDLAAIRARCEAAETEVKRLTEALQSIADFEPNGDIREITHDSESCDECKVWKVRNHPIQHSCDVWYREYYRREDDRRHAESTQHYGMRKIARQALDG